MRKIVFVFLNFILLLSACNKEEVINQNNLSSVQEKELPGVRFYGVKRSGEQVDLRGTARKANLWHPGTSIKIKFMPGSSAAYQQKVKKYAKEWEEYADIHFDFVEDGKAEVRIAFDWNANQYVSWSYVGNDCKMIRNQNEPTMSFAYWYELNENEIRAEVLRSFGMVLGLELEHRNPNFGVNWNYENIIYYWTSQLGGMDWDEIRELVFDPLAASDVYATEYDTESIMIWPFTQRGITQPGSLVPQREPNYELSNKDIEFIKQLYPKDENNDGGEEVVPLIAISMSSEGHDIRFDFDTQSELKIDWGDGPLDEKTSVGKISIGHEYRGYQDHIIKIYGKKDAIKFFKLNSNTTTSLEFMVNTQLKNVNCEFVENLSHLDVSRLTQLENLNCSNNSITTLDLSNSTQLKYLNCSANQISTLSLSNSTQLRSLDCSINQISTLDLSKNTNLEYVSLDYNPLSDDYYESIKTVESLVSRKGNNSGIFALITIPSWFEEIVNILDAKNWQY